MSDIRYTFNRKNKELNIENGTVGLSLDSIGELENKKDVKLLYIPSTVKELSPEIFKELSNVKEIVLDKNSIVDKNEIPEDVIITLVSNEIVHNIEYRFDIRRKKGTVIQYYGKEKEVEIPSEIEDYQITKIGTFAFAGNKQLEQITLPNTIDECEEYAFYRCSNLKKAVLSESLQIIPKGMFYECANLQEINLTKGIRTLEKEAFYGCSSIQALILLPMVKKIGQECFSHCFGLEYVLCLGEELEICEKAFYECGKLEQLYLPLGLDQIHDEAFNCCWNLKTATLHYGSSKSKEITEKVCLFAKHVTNLQCIPVGIDSVNKGKGEILNKVGETDYDIQIAGMISDEEVMKRREEEWIKAGSNESHCQNHYIRLIRYNKEEGRIRVPDYIYSFPVRDVYEGLFTSAKKKDEISRVLMGKHIHMVPDNLFCGMKGIETADISGLKRISGSMFRDCSKLSKVVLGEGLEEIKDCAFMGCSLLKKVDLPKGLKRIGLGAFQNSGLTEVILPSRVVNISPFSFAGCKNLTKVVFLHRRYYFVRKIMEEKINVVDLNFQTFEEIIHSMKEEISDNENELIELNEIYEKFLAVRKIIENVEPLQISRALSCMEKETDQELLGLVLMEIREKLIQNGCDPEDALLEAQVKKVRILQLLWQSIDCINGLRIKEGAFKDNPSLKGIHFREGLVKIGKEAFANCTAMEYIVFPFDIISIDERAFAGCFQITNIRIPKEGTDCAKDAFEVSASFATNHVPTDAEIITVGLLTSLNQKTGFLPDEIEKYMPTGIKNEERKNFGAYFTKKRVVVFWHKECPQITCPEYLQNVATFASFHYEREHQYNLTWTMKDLDYEFFVDEVYGKVTLTKYLKEKAMIKSGEIMIPITLHAYTPDFLDGYPVREIGDLVYGFRKYLIGLSIGKMIEKIGQMAVYGCEKLEYVFFEKEMDLPYLTKEAFYRNPNAIIFVQNENLTQHFSKRSCDMEVMALKGSCSRDKKCMTYSYQIHKKELTFQNKVAELIKSNSKITQYKGLIDLDFLRDRFDKQDNLQTVFLGMEELPEELFRTGAMLNYTSSSKTPWAPIISRLESVILKKGITTVGSYGFENAINLKKVEFPESLECIMGYAFSGCKKLDSVHFNFNLRRIYIKAFFNCEMLSDIEFPSRLTFVGAGAFFGNNIYSLRLKKNLAEIGSRAFMNNVNMEEIFLEMEDELVFGTSNKPTDQVFYNAKDRCRIHTKFTQERILETNSNNNAIIIMPISGTCGKNLKWSLTFDNCLTVWGSGKMDDFDQNTTPWNGYLFRIDKIIIKSGVTSIGKRAFDSCSVKKIILADTVTVIGAGAFAHCYQLTYLMIPKNIEVMEDESFYSCKQLTHVFFLQRVNLDTFVIGKRVFDGMSKGGKIYCCDVKVKEKLNTGTAFLDQVMTPMEILGERNKGRTGTVITNYMDEVLVIESSESNELDRIMEHIMDKRSKIRMILFTGEQKTLKECMFAKWFMLETLILGDNVEVIRKYAFACCHGLKKVFVPDSIMDVEKYAFENCHEGLEFIYDTDPKPLLFRRITFEKDSLIEQMEKEIHMEEIESIRVCYQLIFQDGEYRFTSYANDGEILGAPNTNRVITQLKVKLNQPQYGKIYGIGHVENYGDQYSTEDEDESGVSVFGNPSQTLRLEAIKLQLSGEVAKYYDVEYRVYPKKIELTDGWTEWAKTGQLCGTTGQARPLEAVQIRLIKK